MSSHGRKTTSCVSSLQGTDPTVGSVSCSNRLPRPHLLTLPCSRLELQCRNLGDTNVQFIAETFGLRGLLDLSRGDGPSRLELGGMSSENGWYVVP